MNKAKIAVKKIISSLLNALPEHSLKDIYSESQKILSKTALYHRLLQKNYWAGQDQNWKRVHVPLRPDAGCIEYYKKFIDKTDVRSKILLLGSTPELRDLLADYYNESKIFICDFSWNMLIGMSHYLKKADINKEVWIKADWMDDLLKDHAFDLILGDLVLIQFPPKDEPLFLKKISSILNPGGSFITRVRVMKDGLNRSQADEIIEKIMKSPSYADNDTAAKMLVWSISDLSTDSNTRRIDHEWSRTVIKNALQKHEMPNETLRLALKKIDSYHNEEAVRWTFSGPCENELRFLITKFFEIKKEISLSNYEDTALYPLFHLRKWRQNNS